jgi:GT2 family glycosyltransferase
MGQAMMIARPHVLVCITVYGQFQLALECLQSVMAFTPEDVEILVIDDCSPSPFVDSLPLEIAHNSRVAFHRNAVNLGYVRSANLALSWQPGSDVALVNSDVLVSTEWLERLRDAAYSADHVATASALTNEGSMLTVQLDKSTPAARNAADLLALNLRLAELPRIVAPEIPVAVGHCLYVRAEAISVVGVFDEAFGAGYEEEVDFSLRCSAVGMRHVVAPDVYVLHRGGASFGSQAARLRKTGHRLVVDRYPNYERVVSQYLDRADNLRTLFLRVLLSERQKLRLLIDEEGFGPTTAGSATLSTELTRALSALPQLEVTVVTQSPDSLRGNLPENVQLVRLAKLPDYVSRQGRFDCVLTGSETSSTSALACLWRWAHRVLILQLDYFAYENSIYHATAERFFDYRDAAVLTALTADAMFGLSRFVLAQRVALGVPVDPAASALGGGAPPVAVRAIGRPLRHLALVLGSSLLHENRLYVLRLVERLFATGVEIDVAFVGPEPAVGSSRPDEDRFAREHPELAGRLERYDWLPNNALEALWARTSVVLCPALSEGFGLIPFEAAARSVPSLFGRRNGLADVFPEVPFSLGFRSIEEDAETLRILLEQESARARQVEYVMQQAKAWSSRAAAERLVARLWEVCASPPRIPSDIRRRLHRVRRLPGGLLLRLRRSPLGRSLLPPDSGRAAAVARLVPRRLWRD